jgi:predicted nucleic acid-binding protein
MPETQDLVINTGPILAIIAGLGDLRVLQMYRRVLVPFEVCSEIAAGGPVQFGLAEFSSAHWLTKDSQPLPLAPNLANVLDKGEASVIQLALNAGITTVAIDEAAGRRVARLNGLSVTGSIGILLRAQREGHQFSMRGALDQMRSRGIWLSDRVIAFALQQSGEQ